MIDAINKFESVKYAGLLARAALSLTDNITPNQKRIVDNEDELIAKIVSEISLKYRIDIDTKEGIHKIVKILDDEIDSVMPDSNKTETLLRMAEKAELPSDLYEINVIQNIKDFYGKKFEKEFLKIVETVKKPDNELHYGPPEANEQPFLISLFSKYYKNDFPFNSFILLVVGQREKMKMNIHQVWRVYPDVIPNCEILNLIDLLKAFAEKFGIEMELNNQRGKFFLSDTSNVNNTFNIKVVHKIDKNDKQIPTSFTFSHFNQIKPNSLLKQASLLIAINLNEYKALLEKRKW